MNKMTLTAMEQVEGGGILAGFVVGFAVKMLLDDDFIQGVADGIVGAPRY